MAEIIPSDEDDSNSNLSLPVSKIELGRFLGGLLGQPQSLEKSFDGYFDIDFKDTLNLHEVIDQRISGQNSAQLCYFRAVIYYSDKSMRTLPSLEEFRTHREMLKKSTVKVRLEWSYLINFPGKDLPDKQQISISFRKNDDDVGREFSSSKPSSDVVDIRLDYTERSWAHDLEQIICNEIFKLRRDDSVKKASEKIIDVFEIIIIAIGIGLTYFSYKHFMRRYNEEVGFYLDEFESTVDVDVINVKLTEIMKYLIDPDLSQPSVFLVSLLGISLTGLLVAVFSSVSTMRFVTFLTFTEEDEIYRRKLLKAEENQVGITIVKAIATILVGVLSSLLASFIYDYLL